MRLPPVAFILRRKMRRLKLGRVAVPVMLALAGSGLVVMAWGNRPIALPTPPERAPGSDVAVDPAASKVVARTQAAVAAASDKEQDGDLSERPAFDIKPPLASLDGTSIKVSDLIVRLHGVDGPRADQVCFNEEGHRWACGLQARAALHNLVAQRVIRCQPIRWSASRELEAECELLDPALPSKGGIARQLVLQGWARPGPAAAGSFSAEVEQARSGRLGLWRGGWSISQP